MENIQSQPKNTFFNLPEDKRERFVREAVREFAENGYQRASLNLIVRRVGIAKGSVYQYFENKEALFLHVFDRFTRHVKNIVKENAAAHPDKDFFGNVRQIFWSGIQFIDSYPEYFQIYQKVLFTPDVPCRESLLGQIRLFSLEYFEPLCKTAQEKGELRGDIASPLIIFLLDSTIDRFLQGYANAYLDGGLGLSTMNHHQLNSEIDSIIAVLRSGLVKPPKGAY
jgi:AcrR family transcriptional regulator